jgi:hypothetical protein
MRLSCMTGQFELNLKNNGYPRAEVMTKAYSYQSLSQDLATAHTQQCKQYHLAQHSVDLLSLSALLGTSSEASSAHKCNAVLSTGTPAYRM